MRLRRIRTSRYGPFAGVAAIALALAAATQAQQAQPSSESAGSSQASAAQADRWVHVGGIANQYEEYLDKESVRRTGDKVTLWTRRDPVLGKGTAWNELELDCSARTETILAWIRDDGGIVSHNSVRPHREALPIRSGSVEEKLFDLACR